ncbi:MAG: hypothetical protein D9C04_00275 [Nitrosopumilus sp. B06]|nr:MAG: hypothetical protein D9C04_00275 [Nitrosopumilus sp. B06]
MSDDIAAMLDSESAKLARLLDAARPGITIHEIVKLYYQVINVSSIISMQRLQPDARYLGKINAADKSISRFNAELHPMISEYLDDEISKIKTRLESGESDSYDDLRKMMSTKEFVEQYEKGLE